MKWLLGSFVTLLVAGSLAILIFTNQTPYVPLPELTTPNLQTTVSTPEPSSSPPVSPSLSTTDQVSPSIKPTSSPTSLPKSVQLSGVPFIEQTPLRVWDELHEETCEEAAIMTAALFAQGKSQPTPEGIEQELQAMITWEKEHLGIYEDTTVAQTAEILRGYYGFGDRVRIIEEASTNDLKAELAAGRPVVVPAAGRLLGNRYFQTPGPIYHMTVAIGYTTKDIITNDPGTRRGKDYHYPIDQFWQAVHDFVDRTDEGMATGKKTLLVIDPSTR